MANLVDRGNGRWAVQFRNKDGYRKTVSLGKMPRRMAGLVRARIEELESAARSGLSASLEVMRWLGNDCGRPLYEKLVKVGLAPRRPEGPQLADFLREYMKSRTDVAPNTQGTYRRTANALIDYFGPDRGMASITPGEADQFADHLRTTVAQASASKTIGQARQFYRRAIRLGLVTVNPFDGVKGGTQMNSARIFFVDAAMTEKLLEACPDAEWRLIVALCRYGGLRHPSETQALRWDDIRWADARIIVTSPKTRKKGKANRVIPIFAELAPYLRDWYDLVFQDAGATNQKVNHFGEMVYVLPGQERPWGYREYVLPRRHRNAYRDRFLRIVHNAGLVPWPRLFQNLRASRATELADHFQLKAVTAWMGHTVTVSHDHYLSVTEEHFERAARERCTGAAETAGNSKKIEK
jgi:integrase